MRASSGSLGNVKMAAVRDAGLRLPAAGLKLVTEVMGLPASTRTAGETDLRDARVFGIAAMVYPAETVFVCVRVSQVDVGRRADVA